MALMNLFFVVKIGSFVPYFRIPHIRNSYICLSLSDLLYSMMISSCIHVDANGIFLFYDE